MLNITRFVCILALAFILVVLFACNNSVVAATNDVDQGKGVNAANPIVPKLWVRLLSPKTHLLLGEPVLLSLLIYNAGQESATIMRCSPPGSDCLNYEIAEPGKQPRTFIPQGVLFGSGVAIRTMLLRPSDYFSRTDDLTMDRNGLLVSNHGEYSIHAIYCLPDGVTGGPLSIRSNGVCIIGEEPSGLDKEAYDALIERIAIKSKGVLWSTDSKYIQDYEYIAAKYPKSTYTLYIHYYLAQAYEYYGKNTMKNTTELIPLIQKAITNYQIVAKMSKDTPLGVDAIKLAGRCYATLGKTEDAESAYRDAFCSGATTEIQIETLSWIRHLELGTFYNDSGLAKHGEIISRKVMLPLLPYARALGYELRQDKATGQSVLTNGYYNWVIKPGENILPVCGTLCKDMRVEIDKEGELRVSPSVIAMLIAERYGKDMARQLSFMLTRAK